MPDFTYTQGYTSCRRWRARNLRGVTVNVLILLHYAIHLSITNTSNYHYIQWCSPLCHFGCNAFQQMLFLNRNLDLGVFYLPFPVPSLNTQIQEEFFP